MKNYSKDIIMYEYDYGIIYFKKYDTSEYISFDRICSSCNIKEKKEELEILYGQILDLEEANPEYMVGYRNIQEIKYYLNYKLYVATLLSNEYKEGQILIYGFNKDYGNYQNYSNLFTVQEYVFHLSTLTDEDLKSWLRPDLQ
ncbi:hypothetical protein [Aliarcobacter butzleri]|uniref:hypothetical protein n=1 Tax=Aliarcobacter butzleri TaxID=28197 RepID=UPI002B24F17D|nr:hypothetical protein [Aliarcobacter butzleri]